MEHVERLHSTNIDIAINLVKSLEEGTNLDNLIADL
jgi:hypothetical protein